MSLFCVSVILSVFVLVLELKHTVTLYDTQYTGMSLELKHTVTLFDTQYTGMSLELKHTVTLFDTQSHCLIHSTWECPWS